MKGVKNQQPDYFETYLDYSDAPSVVLVRSVELKHFPREFINPPVLDLGCGDGFFTEILGLRGIYGCDIDENIINEARRKKDVYSSTVVGDGKNLQVIFKKNFFQTIISNCVMEHIDGIDETLDSISASLKKGGHLIFSVPSDNLSDFYFSKLIFRKIKLRKYGEKILANYNKRQHHINIFGLDDWKLKLAKAGLKINKSFFLFNKNEYAMITFMDSFCGSYPYKLNTFFRKITPRILRKRLWRLFLKPIYINSKPLDNGGELIIVAEKL